VHPSVRFAELLTSSEPVRLDVGALLIAEHANRGLEPAVTLGRLDELAARCPAPTLDGLRRVLFGEAGFRGATVDYHAPVNSMLDQVVIRRRGLPITLAVVMIEVGRRLGVPLDGVAMPGHFLVRDRVMREVFVDPFAGGVVLDRDGARDRFASIMGPGTPFDDAYLEPTGPALILARMVANLVGSYRRLGDLVGLSWSCRLRLLCPGVGAPERLRLAEDAALTGQYRLAARTLDELADWVGPEAEGHRAAAVRLAAHLN
jgi:regulator of sirC expression with transglutaminase-like and TPR domain